MFLHEQTLSFVIWAKMVIVNVIPKKKRIFGVCCGFFLAIAGVVGWIIMPYLVVKIIDLV